MRASEEREVLKQQKHTWSIGVIFARVYALLGSEERAKTKRKKKRKKSGQDLIPKAEAGNEKKGGPPSSRKRWCING